MRQEGDRPACLGAETRAAEEEPSCAAAGEGREGARRRKLNSSCLCAWLFPAFRALGAGGAEAALASTAGGAGAGAGGAGGGGVRRGGAGGYSAATEALLDTLTQVCVCACACRGDAWRCVLRVRRRVGALSCAAASHASCLTPACRTSWGWRPTSCGWRTKWYERASVRVSLRVRVRVSCVCLCRALAVDALLRVRVPSWCVSWVAGVPPQPPRGRHPGAGGAGPPQPRPTGEAM
jgi:hypothetical protein